MRCRLCGDENYPASMGGPEVCPACDCGMFHDERGAKRMTGRLGPPTCNERRGEDKCTACLGVGWTPPHLDPLPVSATVCGDCLGTGRTKSHLIGT